MSLISFERDDDDDEEKDILKAEDEAIRAAIQSTVPEALPLGENLVRLIEGIERPQ